MIPGEHSAPGASPAAGTEVMGLRFAAQTERGTARWCVERAASGDGGWVVTANLDHLRRYQGDPVARRLIDRADLVVADGTPVIWAARIAGRPLPARVAGSNAIWLTCGEAAAAGVRVHLLGGDPGVAERAGEVLLARFPGLRLVGTHCPPMGFERSAEHMADIRAELARADPQVVFVALGFPKQDLLIEALRDDFPGVVFMGVGVSLSFIAGDVARAPRWMGAVGLEWVHRLVQEPRRLARRYLLEGLPFAARLGAWAVRARFSRAGG